jgi:hypothetical protein
LTEDLNKYVKLDYSKYRTAQDLEITPEQNIIFYKLEKAKDDYLRATKEKQEQAAKSFPPIFGIDITKVSPEIKILYTVIVLGIFAAGVVYLLSKVQKKSEKKNKKKKSN